MCDCRVSHVVRSSFVLRCVNALSNSHSLIYSPGWLPWNTKASGESPIATKTRLATSTKHLMQKAGSVPLIDFSLPPAMAASQKNRKTICCCHCTRYATQYLARLHCQHWSNGNAMTPQHSGFSLIVERNTICYSFCFSFCFTVNYFWTTPDLFFNPFR